MDARPFIYLDYAATTAVDPRVRAAIDGCLAEPAGNPSSAHAAGRAARARVEAARAEVAALIAAPPTAIVFTSGATEADNLAVLGAARANAARGRHLVSVRTEHRAVLDACAHLEREGFEVTLLEPDRGGLVATQAVAAALRPQTMLVSMMLVNNEIGVVQDIAAVGALCRARGVLLHVDAAQAAGRVPIDVGSLEVDLMSLASHKIHGPAGIGALYVRRAPRPALTPLQFGGGQEGGLRSGTLPVHQIVGMGAAFRIAAREQATEAPRLAGLTAALWARLAALAGVHRNGDPGRCAPHILSVSFEGLDGESLLYELADLAVASGSACASGSGEPSYVLKALGRDDALAQATIRFSVGRPTTLAEVEEAATRVIAAVTRLRRLAPA